MRNYSHLPGVLADIAEATNEAVALTLANELGGTEIHLTRVLRADNKLVLVVGAENARKIIDALGYGPLLVPMAAGLKREKRNAKIAHLRANGEKVANVALGAGVHERTVFRVQRKARGTLPLFEPKD